MFTTTTTTAKTHIEFGTLLEGAAFITAREKYYDEYGCKVWYEYITLNDSALVHTDSEFDGVLKSYREALEFTASELDIVKPDVIRFCISEIGAGMNGSFVTTGWMAPAEAATYIASILAD